MGLARKTIILLLVVFGVTACNSESLAPGQDFPGSSDTGRDFGSKDGDNPDGLGGILETEADGTTSSTNGPTRPVPASIPPPFLRNIIVYRHSYDPETHITETPIYGLPESIDKSITDGSHFVVLSSQSHLDEIALNHSLDTFGRAATRNSFSYMRTGVSSSSSVLQMLWSHAHARTVDLPEEITDSSGIELCRMEQVTCWPINRDGSFRAFQSKGNDNTTLYLTISNGKDFSENIELTVNEKLMYTHDAPGQLAMSDELSGYSLSETGSTFHRFAPHDGEFRVHGHSRNGFAHRSNTKIFRPILSYDADNHSLVTLPKANSSQLLLRHLTEEGEMSDDSTIISYTEVTSHLSGGIGTEVEITKSKKTFSGEHIFILKWVHIDEDRLRSDDDPSVFLASSLDSTSPHAEPLFGRSGDPIKEVEAIDIDNRGVTLKVFQAESSSSDSRRYLEFSNPVMGRSISYPLVQEIRADELHIYDEMDIDQDSGKFMLLDKANSKLRFLDYHTNIASDFSPSLSLLEERIYTISLPTKPTKITFNEDRSRAFVLSPVANKVSIVELCDTFNSLSGECLEYSSYPEVSYTIDLANYLGGFGIDLQPSDIMFSDGSVFVTIAELGGIAEIDLREFPVIDARFSDDL